ncbi:PEP-CTERM domain protein [Planctomycetia bacterium]|nr:PEP-CTERM domain protein [Planctomycetia bacterium]
MRAVIVSLASLLLCAAVWPPRVRADVVIGFEDLTVPMAGFYNGNPGGLMAGHSVTGSWASGGVLFANQFGIDASYGYESWAGFSFSNVAVPGPATFTNQYASYPGGGASSATYAVAYQDTFTPFSPAVTLPVATAVSGFMIANTTYAYGVMAVVDPNGFSVPLATGTGWFATTATGFRGGIITDSATFFLADLRSASFVGVRSGWEWFDLTTLGEVDRIAFTFDGSDKHPTYGLNTPAYFAMDNLTISAVPEPGTWALLGGGVAAWGIFRCRRRGVRS